MSTGPDEVLRLTVRPTRLHGLGFVFGIGGSFLGAYAHDLWQDGALYLGVLGIAAALCALAVACFVQSAVVRRREAVGLRLDAFGMSGYLLPGPIRWGDIRDIDLVRTGSRSDPAVVALDLIEPDAHPFPRQTMLSPLDDGKAWSFDVTVNHMPLRMTPEGLRTLLRDWHRRHGGEAVFEKRQDPPE